MDEEVSIVLLPCGHLISCTKCAPALRQCPICRNGIKGTVRTFMAWNYDLRMKRRVQNENWLLHTTLSCEFSNSEPTLSVYWSMYLLTCPSFFSSVLRNSTPRYVGPSVGQSPFYFFGVFELFGLTAPAQMHHWYPSSLPLPTRKRLG